MPDPKDERVPDEHHVVRVSKDSTSPLLSHFKETTILIKVSFRLDIGSHRISDIITSS